jgi:hypothetical protein
MSGDPVALVLVLVLVTVGLAILSIGCLRAAPPEDEGRVSDGWRRRDEVERRRP